MLAVMVALIGVVLGVYIGVWLLFIGGIVDIIEAIKAVPVDSFKFAFGIVKFLFAPIGWLIIFLSVGVAREIDKS